MSTYAIGDIHGCLGALDRILELVQPTSADTVVTLGDYVNRGPNARGVIDRVIEIGQRLSLVSLRGNHDSMMLAARGGSRERLDWVSMGGAATLESYPGGSLEGVPEEHWEFLSNFCRDWYETDTHLYVHASVNPGKPMAKQKVHDLHWKRLGRGTAPHSSGKTVICGHTAQRSGEPVDLGHTICIDTGCVYGLWLTCLEVETGRYWQTKEEGWSREGHL